MIDLSSRHDYRKAGGASCTGAIDDVRAQLNRALYGTDLCRGEVVVFFVLSLGRHVGQKLF
jgi:hypothetical protein